MELAVPFLVDECRRLGDLGVEIRSRHVASRLARSVAERNILLGPVVPSDVDPRWSGRRTAVYLVDDELPLGAVAVVSDELGPDRLASDDLEVDRVGRKDLSVSQQTSLDLVTAALRGLG